MRRVLPILLLAAALLAAAAVAGVGRPEAARGDDAVRRDTVTTLGSGKVTTVPDTATVIAGVRTEAATAADALAQNARLMERVLASLRDGGGRRMQTRQVSLYPRSDETGRTNGFVAQNSASARTDIARAGALVDAAVGAGANTVEGPMLERSDRDALYREALEQAVADARLKAEALARAGGFDVGNVVAVVEDRAGAPPVPFEAAASRDAATPVEPGQQEVEAVVSVSFEIA